MTIISLGEIQIFVNGASVTHATGIVLRERTDTVFRGAHVQTFFGGKLVFQK